MRADLTTITVERTPGRIRLAVESPSQPTAEAYLSQEQARALAAELLAAVEPSGEGPA